LLLGFSIRLRQNFKVTFLVRTQPLNLEEFAWTVFLSESETRIYEPKASMASYKQECQNYFEIVTLDFNPIYKSTTSTQLFYRCSNYKIEPHKDRWNTKKSATIVPFFLISGSSS
ncbi:unnamed protein product, partial [Arabidopsis halleri]